MQQGLLRNYHQSFVVSSCKNSSRDMAVSFLLPLSCVAGSSCKERVRSAWGVGAEIRSQCLFDISVTGLMMKNGGYKTPTYPMDILRLCTYHYISMFDIYYSMFLLYDHFFPLQDSGYGRTLCLIVRPMLAIRCRGHGRVHQDDHSGA